jgi:hypothetical protein
MKRTTERRILADYAFLANSTACAVSEQVGWLRGFEPPTTGITIQYSNQLSYSHHMKQHPPRPRWRARQDSNLQPPA